MIWVEVTTANVLAHMPTDVLTQYNAWLVTNPTRADRLDTITANTIREFRDAIKSNPENSYEVDETYLPQSAVRHAESIIIFTLAMEIGINMSTAGSSSRTAADIFLRQIPFNRWKTTTEDAPARGTPAYTIPTRSEFSSRTLPSILAFFLMVSASFGGWIKEGTTVYDTGIFTTYTPTNYNPISGTLFYHLYAIDQRLGNLLTGESDPIWSAASNSYASLYFLTNNFVNAYTTPSLYAALNIKIVGVPAIETPTYSFPTNPAVLFQHSQYNGWDPSGFQTSVVLTATVDKELIVSASKITFQNSTGNVGMTLWNAPAGPLLAVSRIQISGTEETQLFGPLRINYLGESQPTRFLNSPTYFLFGDPYSIGDEPVQVQYASFWINTNGANGNAYFLTNFAPQVTYTTTADTNTTDNVGTPAISIANNGTNAGTGSRRTYYTYSDTNGVLQTNYTFMDGGNLYILYSGSQHSFLHTGIFNQGSYATVAALLASHTNTLRIVTVPAAMTDPGTSRDVAYGESAGTYYEYRYFVGVGWKRKAYEDF